MKKSRFAEEQIVGFLQQAETGTPINEVCRTGGGRDAAFHKRRAKYGGLPAPSTARGGVSARADA